MMIVHEDDVQLVPSPNGNRTNGLVTRANGATEMSVVRQEQEAGGFNPPHFHDREEVMILRRGAATVTIDDETVHLVPGDLVLVPSRAVHQVRNTGAETAEYQYVSPSGMRFYSAAGQEIIPSWET